MAEVAKTDPSKLTTDQLRREVASLKTLLETRMDANAEAVKLLQARADKSPSMETMAERVVALDRLTKEHFSANDVAVSAALKARDDALSEQNKANLAAASKAEASFTKQIDQVGKLIEALDKKTDDKVDDLKTRVTAIESTKKGTDDYRSILIAVIGTLIGLGGLALALLK